MQLSKIHKYVSVKASEWKEPASLNQEEDAHENRCCFWNVKSFTTGLIRAFSRSRRALSITRGMHAKSNGGKCGAKLGRVLVVFATRQGTTIDGVIPAHQTTRSPRACCVRLPLPLGVPQGRDMPLFGGQTRLVAPGSGEVKSTKFPREEENSTQVFAVLAERNNNGDPLSFLLPCSLSFLKTASRNDNNARACLPVVSRNSKRLAEQVVRSDAEFLRSVEVMDYSMFITVHDTSRPPERGLQRDYSQL